ncbi:M20/M25/M40 family metallo-hydrolase [Kribbella sp. NPDC050124]|uniref:M20/M25/M40 family metallo-hydrolase n=1 Tax=Kribbella sp. NPDC050124 TaxID=3364114 RepID=UPI00378A24DF
MEWIEDRADEMAELVARLVACRTENPPGRGLPECAAILHDAMDRLGLAPEILVLPGDARVVRGAVGDGDRIVYFHGHFDVVPAQDPAQFTAVRGGGRITGRGTADMKGGIVSMLYGAAAARASGLPEDGRIVIHLVCDEETGSTVGSGYLRHAGLIDPRALAMLTAEQSGEVIWNAAKGALSLRVTVHGRSSHVGQAFKGVNSFLHMLKVAAPLEAYAEEMSDRRTAYRVSPGEAPGSMVVIGGKSGGGSNFNVVPGSTYFTVDGRFNPEEDVEAELTRITRLISEAALQAGAEVTIDVTQVAAPAGTTLDHPAAVLLGECVTEVTGAPARFELCAGCLDTRWYDQVGIPAFGYGPGLFEVSHGPDEYVEEAALHRVAAVYARYANRLLHHDSGTWPRNSTP